MLTNRHPSVRRPALLWLFLLLLPGLACSLSGGQQGNTPLPLPTELAAAPLPDGSQPGGLAATFISVNSSAGAQDGRCHKLLRFYSDGLVLYSSSCFSAGAPAASLESEVVRWFKRENPNIARGDYALLGQRLWLRIVSHDPIHETTYLRLFQGEYCDQELVLQEPALLTYAGVPSDVTQPVLEYALLGGAMPEAAASPCHVAGFRFLWRAYITLAESEAAYRIQTDVGQPCSLRYTAPDGTVWPAAGPAEITADSEGICAWRWPVGNVPGQGIVTIVIDEINQDFVINIQ